MIVKVRSLPELRVAAGVSKRAAERSERLEPVGFRFQPEGPRSPYQFVPCTVPDGVDRDALIAALEGERIECRKYFAAPLHREARYSDCERIGRLDGTRRLSERILSLPMANDMANTDIERICDARRSASSPRSRRASSPRSSTP